MRIITAVFLFILTTAAFGQIDTSSIKISKKLYFEYSYNQRRQYLDNDSIVNDSIISDVKEISYPIIKTADKKLEKFINDTIQYYLGINEPKKSSPKLEWNYEDSNDKPSESNVDYKLNFINSSYFSLTLTSDEYACCGANGASHDQTALTFDLRKRKILVLKDIIEKKYDSLVYNNAITQLKTFSPGLFDYYGEVNNPNLFHFTSTLYLPVAIKNDRIIIYWYISWGGRSTYEEISIYFDKYPNIFHKNFIKTVQKS